MPPPTILHDACESRTNERGVREMWGKKFYFGCIWFGSHSWTLKTIETNYIFGTQKKVEHDFGLMKYII